MSFVIIIPQSLFSIVLSGLLFKGKGVYCFLTWSKGQATVLLKIFLFPLIFNFWKRAERIFCKNLDFTKTYTGKLPWNNNDRRDDDAWDKKKVMIMVHKEKNIETKLPQLGINIKILIRLAVLAGFIGLIWACGASVWTVVAIYLGYKVLRLVLRLFGLLLSVFLTVISILILLLIISLIMF